MRKTAVLLLSAVLATGFAASGGAEGRANRIRFLILSRPSANPTEVRSTLKSLGGRIVHFNHHVGLTTVIGDGEFASRAAASPLIEGVARDRVIGRAPRSIHKSDVMSRAAAPPAAHSSGRVRDHLGEDPLFRYQWHLRQVNVGPSRSYDIEMGDPRVLVGIMDTGISARHPDIGDNLNLELSRNFTRDIPSVDGRCRAEPDRSCDDPVSNDGSGHGTWTASTVAGARNGFGVSGVAPDVTLVNLRAGQDSGYFFLQPVVDALTYAGDNGLDVVNMSFFVDPWLYNCADNPADSPDAQDEQRTIVEATQRAVDYARDRGVTLISSAGNEWTDLGKPEVDDISPDFPPGAAYRRRVDNSCLQMPTEADGVIAVSGTGPSGRKSWLSSYGLEQIDVAAPSGDSFDETMDYPYNMALAAWTEAGARESGYLNRVGIPSSPEVVRRCRHRKCAYWMFAEGTSIASPIAAGVAALIVSAFGDEDGDGGMTMDPGKVEELLESSAVRHDCPPGGVQEYPEVRNNLPGVTPEDLRAVCEDGEDGVNGFYGHGIVNAVRALEPTDT